MDELDARHLLTLAEARARILPGHWMQDGTPADYHQWYNLKYYS